MINTPTFSIYTQQYFLPPFPIVTTVATLSTTGFVVPSCFAASETVIMESGKIACVRNHLYKILLYTDNIELFSQLSYESTKCLNTDCILHIIFTSGEIKAISEVRIGDKILASDSAGNQKYSTVIFIPHKQNNIATLFTHLQTKKRDIKLTSNHVIPAGDCCGKKSLPLLYASQVKIKTKIRAKLFLHQCIDRFRNTAKFYVKNIYG